MTIQFYLNGELRREDAVSPTTPEAILMAVNDIRQRANQ